MLTCGPPCVEKLHANGSPQRPHYSACILNEMVPASERKASLFYAIKDLDMFIKKITLVPGEDMWYQLLPHWLYPLWASAGLMVIAFIALRGRRIGFLCLISLSLCAACIVIDRRSRRFPELFTYRRYQAKEYTSIVEQQYCLEWNLGGICFHHDLLREYYGYRHGFRLGEDRWNWHKSLPNPAIQYVKTLPPQPPQPYPIIGGRDLLPPVLQRWGFHFSSTSQPELQNQVEGWTWLLNRGGTVPLRFLIAAFGVAPVLWIVRRYRRWSRRHYRSRNGLCVACGYDLRSTPGRCPECGEVESLSAVSTP